MAEHLKDEVSNMIRIEKEHFWILTLNPQPKPSTLKPRPSTLNPTAGLPWYPRHESRRFHIRAVASEVRLVYVCATVCVCVRACVCERVQDCMLCLPQLAYYSVSLIWNTCMHTPVVGRQREGAPGLLFRVGI